METKQIQKEGLGINALIEEAEEWTHKQRLKKLKQE